MNCILNVVKGVYVIFKSYVKVKYNQFFVYIKNLFVILFIFNDFVLIQKFVFFMRIYCDFFFKIIYYCVVIDDKKVIQLNFQ